MGQQQSNGRQAHVLERSASTAWTDDTKTTGDLEQMFKDLYAFDMAVKKVKDHMSNIDEFLECSINAMIHGVGEVRKLHDEVESLNSEDKALQKLQKQAEMLERAALVREKISKRCQELRSAQFLLEMMEYKVSGRSMFSL